jgi:outer membrane protein assembly factor BamB
MKKTRFYLILLIILLGSWLTACAGGAVGATSWPGVTVDLEGNTVYVAYATHIYAIDLTNGTEKWRFPVKVDNKTMFFAPPALTNNGQLVAGSYNHLLYSLSADKGEQKWVFSDSKNLYIGGPLVSGEMIFAPSADNNLYALNLAGNLRWKFATQREQWRTPAMDGKTLTLYLPSMDHQVYAVDAETGNLFWKSGELGGAIAGTPTLSPQGVLYVGTLGSEMIKLDAQSGQILWSKPTSGWVWSGPLLKEDKLYFGDLGGTVYAWNAADGSEVWKISPIAGTKRQISGRPLILGDTLYFVADNSNLYAVDVATGNPRWNKTFTGKFYEGPYAAGDTILIASVNSNEILIALDASGVQKWSFIPAK